MVEDDELLLSLLEKPASQLHNFDEDIMLGADSDADAEHLRAENMDIIEDILIGASIYRYPDGDDMLETENTSNFNTSANLFEDILLEDSDQEEMLDEEHPLFPYDFENGAEELFLNDSDDEQLFDAKVELIFNPLSTNYLDIHDNNEDMILLESSDSEEILTPSTSQVHFSKSSSEYFTTSQKLSLSNSELKIQARSCPLKKVKKLETVRRAELTERVNSDLLGAFPFRSSTLSKLRFLLSYMRESFPSDLLILPYRPRPTTKTASSQAKPASGFRILLFPAPSPQEERRFSVLLRILELILQALVSGQITTKRDIYYKDPKLFLKQEVVNRYVDDIAYTLNTTRSCLNVVAAAKGLVSGKFSYTHKNGTVISCCMEDEGLLIPNAHEIHFFDLSLIKFILVIEKEATFRTLVVSRWHDRTPCGPGIIMTAKGFPDISSRHFLHSLSLTPTPTLKPPILALTDHDPWGLSILRTYTHGSQSLAHENENLVTPNIYWLGPRIEDIVPTTTTTTMTENPKDEEEKLLRMTRRDRRLCVGILGRVGEEEEEEEGEEVGMRTTLQIMLMLNVKAEIQILSEKGMGLEGWLDEKVGIVVGG
ncbi:MAG: hypothetical protein M1834_004389 [Cirrosporium novae-zelandiae]|nr:MAG: hypothetical protein M1834_004389 [Cirrosporium novae-zelandiae]